MTKKFFLLISALLTIALTASARRVGVYCHMAATGTQISEDGNIRAFIMVNHDGTANLEVMNLTDKVIFIRRAYSSIPQSHAFVIIRRSFSKTGMMHGSGTVMHLTGMQFTRFSI